MMAREKGKMTIREEFIEGTTSQPAAGPTPGHSGGGGGGYHGSTGHVGGGTHSAPHGHM
jgi:hypothetical protein